MSTYPQPESVGTCNGERDVKKDVDLSLSPSASIPIQTFPEVEEKPKPVLKAAPTWDSIPREIVESIVVNLAHDKERLTRCNIVSRQLHSICRNHLFSTINVAFPMEDTLLDEILSNDARIFDLIQNLYLSNCSSPTASRKRKRDQDTSVSRSNTDVALPIELEHRFLQGLINAVVNRSDGVGLRVLDIENVKWSDLNDETLATLVHVIHRSELLHSVSFPACRHCDWPSFLLNVLTTDHLEHLRICGRQNFDVCNQTCRRRDEVLNDVVRVSMQRTKTSAKKISVSSLYVEHVGEALIGYLFNPECPLDLSDIKELHIVGTRPMWLGMGHFFGRVNSLVWDVYRSQVSTAQVPNPHNIPQFLLGGDRNTNTNTSKKVDLCRFTLCASRVLGINTLFEHLQSRFDIKSDHIEELNVMYIQSISRRAHDVGEKKSSHWRLTIADINLQRTLQRAEEEFKSFLQERLSQFTKLQKINLLIGHVRDPEVKSMRKMWVPSEAWEPSQKWRLASKSAPELHGTGKLFLRTASFDGRDKSELLKKFSSKDPIQSGASSPIKCDNRDMEVQI